MNTRSVKDGVPLGAGVGPQQQSECGRRQAELKGLPDSCNQHLE
ncbi:MAG: hypothetical protein AAFX01_13390 [Cyanobacteria bacterium J06638_28]